MKSTMSFVLVSVLLLVCVKVHGGDPTDGFTSIPMTRGNFVIQKPYDIPLEQRYSFKDGVHRLWVYADDKPHDPNSHTQPRTEIRIKVLFFMLFIYTHNHTFIYILPPDLNIKST